MFDECIIRGIRLAPARFSAPLAGFTHSAFRRLLAELGGCGAVWTEMLAARQILGEDFQRSPWLRRHAVERRVVFQLMVRAGDPLDRVMDRLGAHGVEAVDLNLACDAFSVRATEAGSALFENLEALELVARQARRAWPGPLLAKVRLGSRRPDWEPRFIERLRVLEDAGFDAVTLHPRFFEDKFRRRARHELFPWAASVTRLPIIANGDLVSRQQVEGLASHLQPARAVMFGRMVLARPWLLACWDGAPAPDPATIWRRLCDYIAEDFPPLTALRRVQSLTKYFAANFAFGHRFWVSVGNARDLSKARAIAERFFAGGPRMVENPVVAGI